MNTQLRFQRHQTALNEAYKLRTYIQLSGSRSRDAHRALWRAERVIALLEGEKSSIIQDYFRSIVNTFKASMNPEDLSNERTLLDQVDREEEAKLSEEEAAFTALAPDGETSKVSEPPTSTEQTEPALSSETQPDPDGWSAPKKEDRTPASSPPPPRFGATRYDPEETDPDYGW